MTGERKPPKPPRQWKVWARYHPHMGVFLSTWAFQKSRVGSMHDVKEIRQFIVTLLPKPRRKAK